MNNTLTTYEDKLNYLVTLIESGKKIDWAYAVKRLGLNMNPDSLRKAFNTTEFSGYNIYKYMLDKQHEDCDITELQKLQELQDAIFKERVKLQTANIEKSRILRQEARYEMFYEQIGQFVKQAEPPKFQPQYSKNNKKKYILAIADIHDGVVFKSTNNEYSPQIVEERFEILLNKTIEFVQEKQLLELTVLGLGDFVNGVLRANDLRVNDTSVVKSCVHVSNLMVEFLNKLSAYVKITYVDTIFSNHSQVRYLGTKANAMMDEDLGYIIANYIKTGLALNKRIEVVLPNENDTFVEVPNIFNFIIYCAHGHQVKNINSIVADLTIQRHKPITTVFLGHFHGGKEITVSEADSHNVECIVCNAFCGSDPYADSLYTGAKASCGIYGFDEKYGHTETYKIILN